MYLVSFFDKKRRWMMMITAYTLPHTHQENTNLNNSTRYTILHAVDNDTILNTK